MAKYIRLGVNIDHVATIRNARRGLHPSPVEVALLAKKAGADGITAHLREDRRHILDQDIFELKARVALPLNLEMAPTAEMLEIALRAQPEAVCIVPEKRTEITTEGGIDVIKNAQLLAPIIKKLQQSKIQVSLFVDPDLKQVQVAKDIGANAIEIHTGKFCEKKGEAAAHEFEKIKKCAQAAKLNGLAVHAGHGLNYETAQEISQIHEIEELNIGHFIISEAIFDGIEAVVAKMKKVIVR